MGKMTYINPYLDCKSWLIDETQIHIRRKYPLLVNKEILYFYYNIVSQQHYHLHNVVNVVMVW